MLRIRRSLAMAGSCCAAGRRVRSRNVARTAARTGVGSLSAVVGLAVVAAGCGAGPGQAEDLEAGDRTADSPAGEEADGGGTGSGGGSGPDMNPSGEDPDRVRPHVEELLMEYDRVVNEVVADPSVAEDDDAELIGDFQDLFEPDSEFAAETIELWVEMADEGRRTVPYSDDYPATETELAGSLTSVSAEEVSFPVCIVRRSQVLSSDDEEPDGGLPRLDLSGEGVAVRTDDGWRLREVWAEAGGISCEEEG